MTPVTISSDISQDSSAPVFHRKVQDGMIDAVRIQNFKGFQDLDLPRLTRFTLIGGGNNAGKSSVIEALALYYARLNPGIFLFLQGARGLGELPLEPSAIWAPFFWRYDFSHPIQIAPRIGDRSERLSLSFVSSYAPKVQARTGMLGVRSVRPEQFSSTVYALNVQLIAGNKTLQKSHFVLSEAGLNLEIEEAQAGSSAAAFISSRAGSNIREDAVRFGRLDVANIDEKVLKFLQIVEPKLQGLSSVAVGNTTIVHGDIGMGMKIPIYHMGDGVVRLLNMILSIASSRDGIVFIDEFGNGIHYSILSRIAQAVVAAAREFNVQIIATTHSYELLRESYLGLEKMGTDDFTYIRLDRTPTGIVAKNYDYRTLGAALDQGWEVR